MNVRMKNIPDRLTEPRSSFRSNVELYNEGPDAVTPSFSYTVTTHRTLKTFITYKQIAIYIVLYWPNVRII